MSQTQNPKLEKLKEFIAEKGKDGAVVAFSGGVDSSTLAAITYQVLGNKSVAVIAKSPTYTTEELKDAKRIAKDIGIKFYIVETNELNNPDFAKNPENRCYYCKKELLLTLLDFAHKLGLKAIFEGTNYSDLNDHRPGFKAVKEVKDVYSPWKANEFSKDEIRQLSKQLGLSVHDKPALACLASRIPFNQKITAERLHRIEKAEQAIKQILQVTQLRVRDHNGLARIEISKNQIKLFSDAEAMEKVVKALRCLGFKYVTLDLEGFQSGSMLRTLEMDRI
jgi:uncharacterized protein